MITAKNQTHRVSGTLTPGDTLSHITPYEITLISVQPYPISTEEAKYVATINISGLEKTKTSYNDFRDGSGEITCKGYTSSGGFLEYPKRGPIDQL